MKNTISSLKGIIKKGDIILSLVLIAFGAAVFFIPRGGDMITIKHGDETIYSGFAYINKTINIDGAYHNTIVISDGKVAFTQSDCPNKDCVHTGYISAGMSACLPNRTVVTFSHAEVDDIAQ